LWNDVDTVNLNRILFMETSFWR